MYLFYCVLVMWIILNIHILFNIRLWYLMRKMKIFIPQMWLFSWLIPYVESVWSYNSGCVYNMKLSNTFLFSIYDLSKKCQDPSGIRETMKHMTFTTCRRIKAIYVKDLFGSLVYNRVCTTEVHQLCEKLCHKMVTKNSRNLVNVVMKWKHNDAQHFYLKAKSNRCVLDFNTPTIYYNMSEPMGKWVRIR